MTACQQACPSQAIVFGDLADRKSQVAQCEQDDRSLRDAGRAEYQATYVVHGQDPQSASRILVSESEPNVDIDWHHG